MKRRQASLLLFKKMGMHWKGLVVVVDCNVLHWKALVVVVVLRLQCLASFFL